jgi:tRNA(Ile2)-agmatinylcytidine synthase
MMDEKRSVLSLGIDDADSPLGMCTTYVCAVLVERLAAFVEFLDYPLLIRFNPNIPYKTRGNGGFCIRFVAEGVRVDSVFEKVLDTVVSLADFDHMDTNTGVVMYKGEEVPREVQLFGESVVTGIKSIEEGRFLAEKYGMRIFTHGNGRGIIGALGAIGNVLLNVDHTYEYMAYRVHEMWGKSRRIDKYSVFEMDQKTRQRTFNNIDFETNRVLIAPHGPDPVFFGIRGEDPETVKKAAGMVKTLEPVERWIIFRTNQGTDSHLKWSYKIKEVEPYLPVIIEGEVSSKPETIQGGHVVFKLSDETGFIDCAAYEPTGTFRNIVKSLIIGDKVVVYGGVRPPNKIPMTVNLEKMEVKQLARKIIGTNPPCLKCGKNMKSMGRNQGYECKKCKIVLPKAEKEVKVLPREIKKGMYLLPPRAQRHLTRPVTRENFRNITPYPLIKEWHYP